MSVPYYSDRSTEAAASHARYERERKETPDPGHAGEIAMLERCLSENADALSAEGAKNCRLRIEWLQTRGK